ncbi:MAG: hypothetical protein ACI9VI_002979 [Candidatus Azotimanducaceae bacterium]
MAQLGATAKGEVKHFAVCALDRQGRDVLSTTVWNPICRLVGVLLETFLH